MSQYESASQQKLLSILTRLAGHEVGGLTPGEISQACGVAPASVTRYLANLQLAGLVEQMETKRWRLGPKMVQIAIAHMHGLDRASAKLNETQQRYSREPK